MKGRCSMEDLLNPLLLFKHKLWVKEYAYRMEKWFKGEKQAPIRIDAELHRRCNLNCLMCARRASPYDLTEESKKIEMSTQKWVEIARESGEMGVKVWNISGLGEPLCKPETLFSVMRTLKAYDVFGELTTNGTLWEDKHIEETVRMGWDSVCISIDAPEASIHDALRRVKGTFSKATSTVRRFSKVKKHYRTNLPLLTINMVLNNRNYKTLPSMVKMTQELGADALFVEPMVVFSELGEKLKLTNEQIKELPAIIAEARDLAKSLGIVLDVTAISPAKEYDEKMIKNAGNMRKVLIEEARKYSDKILSIPCYYPWFYLMIRADGSAIHCGEFKLMEDNIRRKSLADVWFGEVLEKVRKMFLQKDLPECCEKCRPNVVEDMRIVRKSINEFRNVEFLQKKYIEFLSEIERLQRELRKSKMSSPICEQCEYMKELERIKHSFSFRILEGISKKRIGRIIKNMLLRKVEKDE